MMDKEDKYLMIADVENKLSELYWEYRDDLSDEGALRLDEELKYLKTQLVNMIMIIMYILIPLILMVIIRGIMLIIHQLQIQQIG